MRSSTDRALTELAERAKYDPAILAECCKEASARLMRTVSIIQRAIAETPLALSPYATSQVETK